jgi:hypothetical protein
MISVCALCVVDGFSHDFGHRVVLQRTAASDTVDTQPRAITGQEPTVVLTEDDLIL